MLRRDSRQESRDAPPRVRRRRRRRISSRCYSTAAYGPPATTEANITEISRGEQRVEISFFPSFLSPPPLPVSARHLAPRNYGARERPKARSAKLLFLLNHYRAAFASTDERKWRAPRALGKIVRYRKRDCAVSSRSPRLSSVISRWTSSAGLRFDENRVCLGNDRRS